ncbi:hypothetical protein K502DRAFT_353659 [Neoconidiobolus thromboides FSU 785]|nr:hypothetical protein K502DRAFT_353659 [Neoconidiobolus thromboides FSU 785]
MTASHIELVIYQAVHDLATIDSLESLIILHIAGGLLGTFSFIDFFYYSTIHRVIKASYHHDGIFEVNLAWDNYNGTFNTEVRS